MYNTFLLTTELKEEYLSHNVQVVFMHAQSLHLVMGPNSCTTHITVHVHVI